MTSVGTPGRDGRPGAVVSDPLASDVSAASSSVAEAIASVGVIPIVELSDPGQAKPVFHALEDAGLAVMEVVLRTPSALHAIARLSEVAPSAIVGAGTIRTSADAVRAIEAGAKFIASPITDVDIVTTCLRHRVDVYPGVFTPTEIDRATRAGARVLKYFPAETGGGVGFINAVAAPMPELRFIPTGGIGLHNLAAYLAVPQVLACGSSYIAARALVEASEFEEISGRAREAARLVKEIRCGR